MIGFEAPPILWRVSNHADLSGIGGMIASARWHSAGRPVVYLAENPSSALLENLVHLELDEEDRPASYQILKVAVDAGTQAERVLPEELPSGWQTQEAVTRAIGDAWLERGETALLQAPSVLTPETWNWIFNPRHGDAGQLRILAIEKPLYDSRLRS